MRSDSDSVSEAKLSPDEARLLLKAIEDAEREEAAEQERRSAASQSPRRSER